MEVKHLEVKESLNANDELAGFSGTLQHKMSKEIQELRSSAALSKQQVADALILPLDEYVAVEQGTMDVTEREYFDHKCNLKIAINTLGRGRMI